MKRTLFVFLFLASILTSQAQWTTSGNINNTNVGAVSINRNSGYAGSQLLIVNPHGAGTITLGEPNTGAGGYTSISMSISAQSNGYASLQAVKSAGASFGVIALNASGGNVGIGTTAPGSFKLAVEGKLGAREIHVTATPSWPDYVFESDYQLMDLNTLAKFVNLHKHLPGVPSAKDVESQGGVDLGAMNTKLLQKIEELTLYVIDLKKQVDCLQKQ